MKRFQIHWSARWFIRVCYSLLILILAGYLGIGLFFKSTLAGDLLIKQLSDKAGRPVHVGQVTLDWFHGFRIVLKNVEVPSLSGNLPPISCESMAATIKIWPFFTRREIIFSHISLKDGFLRLRRGSEGKWQGVIPIPVTPVPRESVIQMPKKKRVKRKFVLFFPRISLKRITVELILETVTGNHTYKMYLKQAEARGSRETETFRGKATGTLQLCHAPNRIRFQIQGAYTLAHPYPFQISVNLFELPLESLNILCRPRYRWHLRGKSRVSLQATGSLASVFTLDGRIKLRDPHFTSPRLDVTLIRREGVLFLHGKGKRLVGDSPELSITASSPVQDMKVRLFKGGRCVFSKKGIFRNLTLAGNILFVPRRATASVSCDYLIGTPASDTPFGRLQAKGTWAEGPSTQFALGVSLSRFPLALLTGVAKRKEQTTLSSEHPKLSSERPFPRILDQVQANIRGGVSHGRVATLASHLSVVWENTRIGFTVSPFDPYGHQPISCRVKADHLTSPILHSIPSFLPHLPATVRAWCGAVQSGEITSLNGTVKVQRPSSQGGGRLSVVRAKTILSNLALRIPASDLSAEGISGQLIYQAPGLEVSSLQGQLTGLCQAQIKQLQIENIFARPMKISGEGRITSAGTGMTGQEIPPSLISLLHLPIGKSFSFIPGFFSGDLHLRFSGTLFPFSVQTYDAELQDILVKGSLKNRTKKIQIPVAMTLSATVQPGVLNIIHGSLATSLGQIITQGTAERAKSGNWSLNITTHGRVIPGGIPIHSLFPHLSPLRLTGSAPFLVNINGTWPRLVLQGNVHGKGLFCSYKDIFVKDTDIPASVEFRFSQTGPRSCQINWIRGNLKGFTVRFWGALDSWSPLKGKINCETDTHQIQGLFPLFPRYCKGEQCLLAKGDIQCHGWAEWGETLTYEFITDLVNLTLPVPGTLDPVTIASIHLLLSQKQRHIDIKDALFRESYVPQFLVDGKHQEEQWIWTVRLKGGYLDLDDILFAIRNRNRGEKRKKKAGKQKQPGEDPFSLLITHLHNRFIKGSVLIDRLKILNYPLDEVFARFQHTGREGKIVGFNFLTRNQGYGAIDVFWKETKGGSIMLRMLPLVKNLDFGKIVDGLLHRSSPFRGILTFHGALTSQGYSYRSLKDALNGHLNVTFRDGIITHWVVLTSIFQILDLSDILTLKNFPGISRKGLEYSLIHGTIQVTHGIAKTGDAYLKSRAFFMSGEGTLDLHTHLLSLLIGVYPFKIIDSFVRHIPIIGRIFTNKDKKFIGYFFEAQGPVTHPTVTSVNVKRLGKRIWDTFKKILTLPLYPFQDHHKKEEKK